MTDPAWIDNHCHLDPSTWQQQLADAQAAGVETLITVGTDVSHSAQCASIAARHPDVWATAGVHPHEARHGTEGLRELLANDEVRAVGEAGFDFYYDHSPRDVQANVFAEQVSLANELDMALVIHTRDAWDETFAVLDREGVPRRTVFHCFTGGPDEADEGLARGCYLSFSGIVTFKSAEELREAARRCPLDRLMVETDSPYLTPEPFRGRPNEPANVVLVGERIAEVKSVGVADVARASSTNARRFYDLP